MKKLAGFRSQQLNEQGIKDVVLVADIVSDQCPRQASLLGRFLEGGTLHTEPRHRLITTNQIFLGHVLPERPLVVDLHHMTQWSR